MVLEARLHQTLQNSTNHPHLTRPARRRIRRSRCTAGHGAANLINRALSANGLSPWPSCRSPAICPHSVTSLASPMPDAALPRMTQGGNCHQSRQSCPTTCSIQPAAPPVRHSPTPNCHRSRALAMARATSGIVSLAPLCGCGRLPDQSRQHRAAHMLGACSARYRHSDHSGRQSR
jgi:hypothetical protein